MANSSHNTFAKSLLRKLKESLFSVIPVSAIVAVLAFTPLISLSLAELSAFIVSSLAMVLGIGLFNMGADLAMSPMGEHIGSGLSKTKKLSVIMITVLIMGVLVTVAEPDLSVLASQVKDVVNGTLLIACVGAGVGLFLLLSVIKIVFRGKLTPILMFFYMVLFALTALVLICGNNDFVALSFDSGGVTTGPITVPFIMALGVGIATTLGGKDSAESSFGLIALCSIGPILAVSMIGVTASGEINYTVPDYSLSAHTGSNFIPTVLSTAKDVGIALGLIVVSFAVLQIIFLKLPAKKLEQIAIGIAYTFVGLVVFLSAVNMGFMPVGYKIGTQLAGYSHKVLVAAGVILGAVTVLAEPAVHVLNRQVEDVTDGNVSKTSMLVALSAGVGLSIGLSMLRICLDFNVLYYLIPGYLLSLGLSFFVPSIYTAIAFDSGGVASGPLTSGFILPLAIGACCAVHGEAKILADAFGVVAMVAMTPLITIQLLGFKSIVTRKVKADIAMRRMLSADDEQIIDFM